MLRRLLLVIIMAVVVRTACGAMLTAEVRDIEGNPVVDAVVSLNDGKQPAAPSSGALYRMRQINEQFDPHVLVVPVGAQVLFPNEDPVRHHVYSFSPPKPFELKLYGRGEVPSVQFDQPGVVALGCNIHDKMRAYIYVVEAQYFSKTNEQGIAEFKDLPASDYNIEVWHPRMREPDRSRRKLAILDGDERYQFFLDLNPARQPAVVDYEQGDY
jgi:plastocyanin